jgi:hypothetical protein
MHFVEDRVNLASAAPFAVDYGDRLVVNHWRFRHRMTPERIFSETFIASTASYARRSAAGSASLVVLSC